MSMHRQSCSNPVSMHCQSSANPMSTHSKSANAMPIQCQSCVDPTPFKSYRSSSTERQSIANPMSIQCPSRANPLPIRQSNANPVQSWTNLSIHCQYPNQNATRTMSPDAPNPPSTNLSATNNQNSIFTDWQRIGMHRHRSRQSGVYR